MAVNKYSRFQPDGLDEISLEDLIQNLSDYFLGSGFQSFQSFDRSADHSMTDLQEAILNALLEQGKIDPQTVRSMLTGDEAFESSDLERLLERVIEWMQEEGYIRVTPPDPNLTATADEERPEGCREDEAETRTRFELTNKTIDFLGFKSLRDLLGGFGKSSFGYHETKELATGVEVSGGSKPYEFGDTLNLDTVRTLLSALRRGKQSVPIEIEPSDLYVHQSEYRSSCATVLMLDCSHSMILYGEDRFTPAKKVALALAHLIRTQYPGDSLHLVLFHDGAEEVPLRQLAAVQVGPFHTNTFEGLRLSQSILSRERKDMRQIIMITDGKPSAITLEDGHIYKNSFGLDPLILDKTFKEVIACRRSGVVINTFMLARDSWLVGFVKKVTEIVRGKAYFTTPVSLGRYVLLDYVNKKNRIIH